MAHCLSNSSFGRFVKTPPTEIDALKEEIKGLKLKLKSCEQEHASVKGFLEQKVEFLEDQVNTYKEREDNIKKINQSVMNALEEMGKQDPKHGLKIKAFEELEKASQQYNQSLFEMKIRMREEIAKLQIENKKLLEDSLEKDYKLRVLKQFIEDIRDEYINMKPTMIIHSRSSPQKDDEEGNFRRPLYLYDELWDKLCFEREGRTVKPLEGGLLRIGDEDGFFARSVSQPLETAASEPKGPHIVKITSSKSEAQPEFYPSEKANVQEVTKTPREETGKNQIPSLAFLLSPNSVSPRDQETNRKALSTIEDKQTIESLEDQMNERKFQVPKHVFSTSTLTLNSEVIKANSNDQYPHFETPSLSTVKEKTPFSQRDEDTKQREKLVLKDFWRSKNASMEQQFGLPRDISNVSGAAEILDIADYDGDQYNLFQQIDKSVRVDREQEHSPGFYEDSEYNIPSKQLSRRQSNVISHFGNFGNQGNQGNAMGAPEPRTYSSRHVRTNNMSGMSGRLNFLGAEEDDNVKTETKYMMGRLLKVKRKLDKKSIELNASISQGYEYSQMNMSNFTKKSISEPQYKLHGTVRKDNDLMLQAMASRSNMNTPRQVNNRSQWYGPREDLYSQKSYR